MYTTETSSEFVKVSKTNLCPLCGKPDWCKTSPDNKVVMCPRTDTAPTGWKRIKTTVDGQGIYKLETEDNFEAQVSGRRPTKKVSKAKALPVPPVQIGIKLAKIKNTTAPERKPISGALWNVVRRKVLEFTPTAKQEDAYEITYSYGDDKTVYRAEWTDTTSPKGYRKTFLQSHVDDGLLIWKKGKQIWNAYRIDEVLRILENVPASQPVVPLMLEGESNVEIARSHGILSTTLQGSNWSDAQVKAMVKEFQNLNCPALLYIYDNDETGLKKANHIKDVCDREQFPCVLINPKVIFPEIPEKGDIKEILAAMSSEEFIRRIEDELHLRAKQDKEHQENLAAGNDEPDKPPLPQIIGGWFAEELREQLLYSEQHQSWMAYGLNLKGVWTAVGDTYVLNAIEIMCRKRSIYPNNNYVSNILGTLKRILFCLEWKERPSNELLPFNDGVLQIETKIFREHVPGDRLTWSLERPYRGSAVRTDDWGAISQWLDEATEGNAWKKKILLAFAAAALRGMSSVQKFLMLTGPGGTGKGVFSHLLTMVLGERNTWIGNLEDLNKPDRIAELQTKRLALFDDQERYMGNLSNFRSLTGGGKISGRQLYKSAINFTFNGLALVTANQPCFPATGISWLKRRIIQQEFRHHPAKRNIHLQRQLEPELSAFTRHLLSIPVTDIERVLGEETTGLNHTFWEDRIQADPLASWINDNLIHEAGAEVAIGSDKDEWKDGNYDAARSTAFGSYNYICRSGNSIPLSKNKFSANLIELCQSVLGWRDVAKIRKGDARYIAGVRLRTPQDSAILPLDQTLNDDDRCQDDNLDVNLNSIPSMACADVDNLLQTISEKNTKSEELTQKMEFESTSPSDFPVIEKLEADIANVSTSHTQQDIQPSQGLHSGLHPGQHSEFNEDELDLLQMIRLALAEPDPESAWQAAADILPALKEVCGKGSANREKIWAALTEEERIEFTSLAKNSERPTISERSPKPSALGENAPEPEAEQLAPEPAPAGELAEPEPAQIAPEDAKKIRDIALIWWRQYYPEHLQNLLTQMYGWKAPGTRYDAATITAWLEGEDALVRERIGELMQQRR
ncbi:DUF5906 domain-containing protein [Microcoleus sp. MON1_C5]|uniref:DUF5906 domain-containing protein n=1 Tax=Microcoleus sp. MON1_C5 TaxID=2818828 RepID=UPI002FD50978